MKHNFLYFSLSVFLTFILVSCSNNTLQKMGITKKKPNQFSVSRKAPLEMPPDMYLRPPKLKNERKENFLYRDDEQLSIDQMLDNNTNKKNKASNASMKKVAKEKRILKKILKTKATVLK